MSYSHTCLLSNGTNSAPSRNQIQTGYDESRTANDPPPAPLSAVSKVIFSRVFLKSSSKTQTHPHTPTDDDDDDDDARTMRATPPNGSTTTTTPPNGSPSLGGPAAVAGTADETSSDHALFQLSASREARAKLELLERRMTTTTAGGRSSFGGGTPTSEDGRGMRRRSGGGGTGEDGAVAAERREVERCEVEDSESDSDDEDAERADAAGYGVVASGDKTAGDTRRKNGSSKRRRRGSVLGDVSDMENSKPPPGSGGFARSRKHPGGLNTNNNANANVNANATSLLDRFENTGSGFKSASPLMEATPSQGYVKHVEEERDAAERRAKTLEEELEKTKKERDDLDRGCDDLRAAMSDLEKKHADESEKRRRGVHQLAVNLAALERKQMRMQIAEEGLRLGTIGVQRIGSVLQEVWEDGRAFHELDQRLDRLAESKKLAEEKRKEVKKRLPPPGSAQMDTAAHAEYVLSEEVHKARMAIIRKEEEAIKNERESLEREKAAHIRALKRVRDEDGSRFNKHPVLGDRYVLMNLLGRGGFSEVYKAWDCVEMREVACKLHQLNPQWSEERKRTYVRHAARECSIHKSLDHPHVVRLIDVFEVDSDSFCTVLELCTGDDLDARLKAQGSISEREARAILAQVFNGLAYMSSGQKRIIHYDLKPGNILFDEAGRVKITDFGLSKVMEERPGTNFGADSGMELTSQGAGTYWYLPPECFETGPAPPKISSKVDTWSCGVILFQMIYGKRPFGHEMSQEQILHAGTIRNAKNVEFPSKPSISPEGKAFITRCLAYKQSERPDVLEASQDPYMTFMSK
jgi:tousled-like kinase